MNCVDKTCLRLYFFSILGNVGKNSIHFQCIKNFKNAIFQSLPLYWPGRNIHCKTADSPRCTATSWLAAPPQNKLPLRPDTSWLCTTSPLHWAPAEDSTGTGPRSRCSPRLERGERTRRRLAQTWGRREELRGCAGERGVHEHPVTSPSRWTLARRCRGESKEGECGGSECSSGQSQAVTERGNVRNILRGKRGFI